MKIDYAYHYRKFNSGSAENLQQVAGYYQRVLGPYLPSDKSVPVLDIGCGMGLALLALRQFGFRNLQGIDSDDGQVAACRAAGLDVTRTEDSTAFMNVHAGEFGLILALDLLEHIPPAEQINFVAGIATALRPGGTFLASTPNASSILASRFRHLDWTHQTAFTEHSLDFLLHTCGFHGIKVFELDYNSQPALWWLPGRAGRHWWAFRFFRLWRRLEMMAELGPSGRRVPLSPNLLAVATKP